MSEALERFIERSLSDEAFAARLRTDLSGAMAEFGLTKEEQEALTSRDPAQMQALGVDERITKKFTGGGRAAY